MAGAADRAVMTESDLAATVERQRLERVLVLFPDEVVKAVALAKEQAAELAEPVEQAP